MAPHVFDAARSGDAAADAVVRREADDPALAALTVRTKLALPTVLLLACHTGDGGQRLTLAGIVNEAMRIREHAVFPD